MCFYFLLLCSRFRFSRIRRRRSEIRVAACFVLCILFWCCVFWDWLLLCLFYCYCILCVILFDVSVILVLCVWECWMWFNDWCFCDCVCLWVVIVCGCWLICDCVCVNVYVWCFVLFVDVKMRDLFVCVSEFDDCKVYIGFGFRRRRVDARRRDDVCFGECDVKWWIICD